MATSKGKGGSKSPLSKKTNQRRNTQSGREQMSGSSFALPEKKKYRIDDRAHAANAKARVEQHGTPEEKRRVEKAVARKYPGLGQQSSRGKGKK